MFYEYMLRFWPIWIFEENSGYFKSLNICINNTNYCAIENTNKNIILLSDKPGDPEFPGV